MIKHLYTSKEKLKDINSYILMMIAFFIPLSSKTSYTAKKEPRPPANGSQ